MPVIPKDYYKIADLMKLKTGQGRKALVEFYQTANKSDRNNPVEVQTFEMLSIVAQLGFKHIRYESQRIPLEGGLGIFWINPEHAKNIAQVLNSDIESFNLVLSTEQEGSFTLMADNINKGTLLEKLDITHMTYDEVTVEAARGIARLIHALSVRHFSLWAAEYDEGALDALVDELEKLNNSSLESAFIGDSTQEDGTDEIVVEKLKVRLKK